MGRGGRTKERGEPERRCIATGEVRPAAELIRFVVGPGDMIVPDLLGKLPGRGIWVSADRAALELAVKKRLFARGAKQAVTLPDDLVGQIETGLLRRVTDGLALARKAGDAIAGYEKVKSWLDSGEATVLIQASDGSERGKTKLRMRPEDGEYIGCLTANELGLAFGREHVIHGALRAGGLTSRVVEDAAKLSAVRGNEGADGPAKGTKTI